MTTIAEETVKQIDEFTASVRADPKLANGFTAVGMSQGNLVIRAYIERVNSPPVHKFISICGPHAGEGTCPDNTKPVWVAPYDPPQLQGIAETSATIRDPGRPSPYGFEKLENTRSFA